MIVKKAFSLFSIAAISLVSFAGPVFAVGLDDSTTTVVSTMPTVTLVSYVDGQPSTAATVNNDTFSMHVKFTGGEGDYLLGPVGVNTANPYQLVETLPSGTNNFSTYENIFGAVGASCASQLPYIFSGYSVGDSLSAAAAASPTMTMPDLSNISTNKFIVVYLCLTYFLPKIFYNRHFLYV